jgi:3-dehydroquinate synthase
MGLITATDAARLTRVVARSGLPVVPPKLGVDRYLELMGRDKKVAAGAIRFVLLRALGEAFVTADVPPADLAAVLGA